MLQVDDVETAVAALRHDGVPFRTDIISGIGTKQVLIEDPSGNPVELYQPSASRSPPQRNLINVQPGHGRPPGRPHRDPEGLGLLCGLPIDRGQSRIHSTGRSSSGW